MNARLVELAREFTRLGLTAFGGPAAHIAIMQREFVDQKCWLTRERFVDLLGLSSLLPGPSSTEVALGIGYERARWPGLLVAAGGFILPASLIVLVIAVAYAELGSLSWVDHLLYGMSPVVIAVIAVLMAILMPSLRLARDQAKRVHCVSNTKTLAMGWYMYMDENDQKLVPGHTGTNQWVDVPDEDATVEE